MPEPESSTARDHLANERTLLAWIRTALTVVGLGFLVDRLAVQGQASAFETWAGVAIVFTEFHPSGSVRLAGTGSGF